MSEAEAGAATCVAALFAAENPLWLLEPQGPLACAYDLWGEAALTLYLTWGEAPPDPAVTVTGLEGDRARAVASWGEQGHGTTLELRLRPAAPAHPVLGGTFGVGWQVYSALPRTGPEGPLSPAFALAEAGGMRAPWRSPAPDEVEALLRARAHDHLLGPEAVLARILTWRLAARVLELPPLSPAAWAAAMEYQVTRNADLATACYGASRRELERAIFLLEAGWRLHGS